MKLFQQAVDFCSEMGIAMTIEDSWGGKLSYQILYNSMTGLIGML